MTRRQALGTWLAGACLALGCSWFVDPLDMHPRCDSDAGKYVCPPGLTCQAGRCERFCTLDGSETCDDNIDNDCDGIVDEEDKLGRETCGDREDNDCDGKIDEDSDRDLDGVNYCGNTRPLPDGGLEFEKVDCDDGRREVSPKQVEVCDNLDNDCNNLTDDVPAGKTSLCPSGLTCYDGRCIKPSCAIANPAWSCPNRQVCSPETGACEAVAVGCADVVCPETQECDPVTTKCRERPKRSNGVACLLDGDCISGTCIDAAALRLASGLRVCGQACCGDSSCGEGERCFASGTGARSCLPVAMLPASAAKQCTTDMSCTTDQRCGLENYQRLGAPNYAPLTELTTSVCRAEPDAGRKLGEGCTLPSPTTCSSNTCVTAPYAGFICSTPCGRSEDCKAFGETAPFRWYPGSPPGKSYCRYLAVHPREGDKTDYASLCVVRRIGETGEGDWGDQCSTAQDCRDRGCVGATGTVKGRCLIACCDNSQCGPNENGRFGTCRPFAIGMGYEMRCETPTLPP